MWLIMRSLLCLPLHFVNSLMHYTCLFIDCHRGRVFSISMPHSWRPPSHFFFLVRLTQLHVTRLAALQWLQHDQFLSLRVASLSICDTGIQVLFQCAPVNHAPLKQLYYAHNLSHIGPLMNTQPHHQVLGQSLHPHSAVATEQPPLPLHLTSFLTWSCHQYQNIANRRSYEHLQGMEGMGGEVKSMQGRHFIRTLGLRDLPVNLLRASLEDEAGQQL